MLYEEKRQRRNDNGQTYRMVDPSPVAHLNLTKKKKPNYLLACSPIFRGLTCNPAPSANRPGTLTGSFPAI